MWNVLREAREGGYERGGQGEVKATGRRRSEEWGEGYKVGQEGAGRGEAKARTGENKNIAVPGRKPTGCSDTGAPGCRQGARGP